jgi:hypothetical protein
MKTENTQQYTPYTFNDEFLSIEEKNSKVFGKKVAEKIYEEWFMGGKFQQKQNWVREMRGFASGTHDMSFYKKWLCGNDHKLFGKYFNVNFKERLKILPTLLNSIENNIDETLFKPKCSAIDPVSIEKKNKQREGKIALMASAPMLQDAKNLLGLDMTNGQPVPESIEEIDLDLQLNGKSKLEEAEEILINVVLNDNKYKTAIKPFVNKDLVEIGIGVNKCVIDNHRGLLLEYTDPENWGHSPSNDVFLKDCNYFFEYKELTISELKNLTNEDLSVEYLKKTLFENSMLTDNEINKVSLPCLFFCYKTSHLKTYKKKPDKYGNFRLIDKTIEGYNPPKNVVASEKIEDSYDVWYEGIYVIRSDKRKLVKWSLMENMTDYEDTIYPPYIAIAPNIRNDKYYSLLSQAIPSFHNLQRTDIKIQHLLAELKPNTIYIDEDLLLNGIKIGDEEHSAMEVLAMFMGTGVLPRRNTDENGLPVNPTSITEQQNIPNPGLMQAVNLYNFYLNQLKYSLGVNDYVDSTTPNPKTLVGAMEIARASSNTITRHITNASLMLSLNTCQLISSRFDDVFKYSQTLKKLYESKLSFDSISTINEIKDRNIAHFGIYIDYTPDNEDRINFETALKEAQASGQIGIDTVLTIRRIDNIRIAEKVLKQEIRKNLNRVKQDSFDKINANADANARSSQAAEQMKQQTAMLEAELKAKLLDKELQNKVYLSDKSFEQDYKLQELTIQGKLQIGQIQAGMTVDLVKYKKDRDEILRMKAINQSAKNQSELINQRKYGISPLSINLNDEAAEAEKNI